VKGIFTGLSGSFCKRRSVRALFWQQNQSANERGSKLAGVFAFVQWRNQNLVSSSPRIWETPANLDPIMKRAFLSATSLLLAASTSMHAGDFKFGSQKLTVPDGFDVELVAGTNLVQRPISMDYDEQGRLYVTDSSGSSERGPKQLEEKSHRILRLEDTDGDGKFDKTVVYADKVMFPEGCLWYDGSLYVSAPPSIWKFTDGDGDGLAEKREEWHEGKTLTGCANDLHGPYLGPDGFFYWGKGAFAEQSYEVNGKPFTSKAAHIFRARPDHSRLEPVLTGGMDNPVGIAFSSTGERFLAGTFFEPHIPGMRDGVIHAIYGGVYGKPHPDVLENHKKTGELMPILIHLGPAASATVISYKSQVFGSYFQDNLFVGNFNLHNVTRHILVPDGATFKTKDSTFLSSDDPDFHPTCVMEDADGSLLVVDTGGWYKICCPTSQLAKPDVFGAIYRIRKTTAPKIEDARGLKINFSQSSPEDLSKLLGDQRPSVVEKAIQQLAKQKGNAIPALAKILGESSSATARRNAVWALTRIDAPQARLATLKAFTDRDGSVVATAFESASVWRDTNSFSSHIVVPMVDKPHLQRISAEHVGRSTTDEALKKRKSAELLQMAGNAKMDRVLEHSIAYALIEMNEPAVLVRALATNAPSAQRISLIGLDQMDRGGLTAAQVAPLLLSTNTQVKETAAWVVSHHPEWGETLVSFFRDALAKKEFSKTERNELAKQLSALAPNKAMQELLNSSVNGNSKPVQMIALRAMAMADLKTAPSDWGVSVAKILTGSDPEVLTEAIATASKLSFQNKPEELNNALMRLARNEAASAGNRLNALSAVHGQVTFHGPLLNFLIAHLEPKEPVLVRAAAANVLARAKLTDEQLETLADSLKTAGPLEVSKLLVAFEKSTNEALGLKVVSNLKEAKSQSSLRVETLKQQLGKYPAPVQAKLKELTDLLNVDADKQSARVTDLVASLKEGDVRRGQALFNNPKIACSSCHAIGYGGGHVGPDLTRIGQVRTPRDLIESIVYPSASFVRSFEPMIVTTKSDDQYSGILKKDTADEVILVTGPNAETRIARADITEIRPGTVSVMPQGLDEQLTKQELADLVAFLMTRKK
jgi:putative membrane-bound dehydrogenase-like protein